MSLAGDLKWLEDHATCTGTMLFSRPDGRWEARCRFRLKAIDTTPAKAAAKLRKLVARKWKETDA